jgi:hypothetical protein
MMLEKSIKLVALPHNVYKVSDPGHVDSESCCFCVLIQGDVDEQVTVASARLELMADSDVVKTIAYGAAGLEAIKGIRFQATADDAPTSYKHFADQVELFDFRFVFSEMKALHIDEVVCELELVRGNGEVVRERLVVPLQYFSPKTDLVFPVKGACLILQDYFNYGGHTEWSSQFAIDIFGLTATYAMMTAEDYQNETLAGWGREIIAPAAGVVSYARNDVPDQPQVGLSDQSTYESVNDPIWAIGGNSVVIDHENGEFSFLMHLQCGSVQVDIGDRVSQGQVLGTLGNAGNSTGPHLHYHLQAGPKAFAHDGLPLRFVNLPNTQFSRGTFLFTE